jgi:hypothetical protein
MTKINYKPFPSLEIFNTVYEFYRDDGTSFVAPGDSYKMFFPNYKNITSDESIYNGWKTKVKNIFLEEVVNDTIYDRDNLFEQILDECFMCGKNIKLRLNEIGIRLDSITSDFWRNYYFFKLGQVNSDHYLKQ